MHIKKLSAMEVDLINIKRLLAVLVISCFLMAIMPLAAYALDDVGNRVSIAPGIDQNDIDNLNNALEKVKELIEQNKRADEDSEDLDDAQEDEDSDEGSEDQDDGVENEDTDEDADEDSEDLDDAQEDEDSDEESDDSDWGNDKYGYKNQKLSYKDYERGEKGKNLRYFWMF